MNSCRPDIITSFMFRQIDVTSIKLHDYLFQMQAGCLWHFGSVKKLQTTDVHYMQHTLNNPYLGTPHFERTSLLSRRCFALQCNASKDVCTPGTRSGCLLCLFLHGKRERERIWESGDQQKGSTAPETEPRLSLTAVFHLAFAQLRRFLALRRNECMK